MVAYKKPYRGRRGRSNLKQAKGANSKARAYNSNAKMASVVAVAKQVKKLKKSIYRDREMKHYTPTSQEAYNLGQLSANSSGASVQDLEICKIAQGVDEDQRIGREIVLKGFQIRCQLIQQVNTLIRNRFIVDVWKTTDMQINLTTFRSIVYDVDSISAVVDANSTINWEACEGVHKLVGRKIVNMAPDTTTGERSFVDFKMFIKQNQKLGYTLATSAVPTNVRYILVIRAQCGNASTIAATLSTVPVTAAETGVTARVQHTDWFVDN